MRFYGPRVRQGLTDFLTVLVAEQSVFTSQDTLAQTERDVALQLVALYKAVGGGWEATGQEERRGNERS